MIIKDLKIKDSLSYEDRVTMTRDIADALYDKTDDDWTYTPYMVEPMVEFLFYLYALDGVTYQFDEDGNLEDIVSVSRQNKEVHDLYVAYIDGLLDNKLIVGQMNKILNDAYAIANFEANKYIAKRKDELGTLIESFGQLGRLIKSIDLEKLNSELIHSALLNGLTEFVTSQTQENDKEDEE